jgi:hypothetical protein
VSITGARAVSNSSDEGLKVLEQTDAKRLSNIYDEIQDNSNVPPGASEQQSLTVVASCNCSEEIGDCQMQNRNHYLTLPPVINDEIIAYNHGDHPQRVVEGQDAAGYAFVSSGAGYDTVNLAAEAEDLYTVSDLCSTEKLASRSSAAVYERLTGLTAANAVEQDTDEEDGTTVTTVHPHHSQDDRMIEFIQGC